MQSAGCAHDGIAGSQVQMVGIAQDNLRLDPGLKVVLFDPLDRCQGSHGHENGGLDDPMIGCQFTQTGFSGAGCFNEFEQKRCCVVYVVACYIFDGISLKFTAYLLYTDNGFNSQWIHSGIF